MLPLETGLEAVVPDVPLAKGDIEGEDGKGDAGFRGEETFGKVERDGVRVTVERLGWLKSGSWSGEGGEECGGGESMCDISSWACGV